MRVIFFLPTLIIVLISMSSYVSSRSMGGLDNCDLTPTSVTASGQPAVLWPNGRVGMNLTFGRYSTVIPANQKTSSMPWAWWPRPANYYTFRTSDNVDNSNDPTMYTPNQPIELHLRVKDVSRKWIGIALYATNGTGTPNTNKDAVVGSWTFPPNAPFQTYQCTMNKGATVTHVDANLKPIHTRFFFTAPKGSGKLTFRLLIKQGEQNKGNFWYLPVPLVLTEGPVKLVPSLPQPNTPTSSGEPGLSSTLVSQYVIGTPGRACADVCNIQTPATPYCHSAKTIGINSLSTLQTAVTGIYECVLPYFQGCVFAGAAYVTSDEYCAYRSTDLLSCPKAYQGLPVSSQPNVCFTQPAPSHKAICACSNDKMSQPVNPFQTQPRRRLLSYDISYPEDEIKSSDSITSAAASSTSSISTMLIMSLVALVSSMLSSKSRNFMILLVCMISLSTMILEPTSAHNYLKGLHRAREAAVSVPCQKRIGNQPHVQVIKNQVFEIEWSLGHGDWIASSPSNALFYFAIVKEEDYDTLAATNIKGMIEDYIKLSPQNASIIPVGWNKVHLHNQAEDGLTWNTTRQYFETFYLPKSDPSYVPRDDAQYRKYAHPSRYQNDATNIESKFYPNYTQNDKRASYASTKYPFVHATIFHNVMIEHATVFDQSDIARFALPTFATAGNYVLYFSWEGYKDCVDINLLDSQTPVPMRYGNVTGGLAANTVKLDHCDFHFIPDFYTSCRKVDKTTMDVSACVQDCQKANGCTSVQVVRLTNPAGTLPTLPNIPFTKYYQTDPPLPDNKCGAYSAIERATDGCPPRVFTPGKTSCNVTTMGLKNDDYICFGVVPLRNQDLQVQEDFNIALDKEEPAYYSTCYFLDPDRSFINLKPEKHVPPSYKTSETCVPCGFYNSTKGLTSQQAPLWANGGVASSCMDCDLVNSFGTTAQLNIQMKGANLALAGRIDAQQPSVAPTSSSSTGSSTPSSSSTASTGTPPPSSSSTASNGQTNQPPVSSSTSDNGQTSQPPVSSSTSVVASTAVVASSSSAATASPTSSSSSTGSAVTAESAVQVTLRLALNFTYANSNEYKTLFSNLLCDSLGINRARCVVLRVRALTVMASTTTTQRVLLAAGDGVDIDFHLLPSTTTGDPTVATVKSNLDSQFSNPVSPLRKSLIGNDIDTDVALQAQTVPPCEDGTFVTPCPSNQNGQSSINSATAKVGITMLSFGLMIASMVVSMLS